MIGFNSFQFQGYLLHSCSASNLEIDALEGSEEAEYVLLEF